jgi:hypothetical protein
MAIHRPAVARWTLSIFVIASCGEVTPMPETTETKVLPIVATQDLDLLILVDNSPGMKEKQDALISAFPRLLETLAGADGTLPNLHLGVATSDMGTSGAAPYGQCTSSGDGGTMHNGALVLADGARYLSDVRDPTRPPNRLTNFTGSLDAAFRELASVGSSGCGFEQHLSALRTSLTSPVNVGFLRRDAFLSIVVLADEDDCSTVPSFFGAAATLTSFHCTAEGIACDDVADMRVAGERHGCHVRTNPPLMQDVAAIVADVRNLKAAPDLMTSFAIIAGPKTPFAIGLDAISQAPKLLSSCSYAGTSGPQASVPALRLSAAANAFAHHVEANLCQADLAPAMREVGRDIVSAMRGDPCFARPLQLPVHCTVTDEAADGASAEISPCNATGDNLPCWRVETNGKRCPAPSSGSLIVVARREASAARGETKVVCAVRP